MSEFYDKVKLVGKLAETILEGQSWVIFAGQARVPGSASAPESWTATNRPMLDVMRAVHIDTCIFLGQKRRDEAAQEAKPEEWIRYADRMPTAEDLPIWSGDGTARILQGSVGSSVALCWELWDALRSHVAHADSGLCSGRGKSKGYANHVDGNCDFWMRAKVPSLKPVPFQTRAAAPPPADSLREKKVDPADPVKPGRNFPRVGDRVVVAMEPIRRFNWVLSGRLLVKLDNGRVLYLTGRNLDKFIEDLKLGFDCPPAEELEIPVDPVKKADPGPGPGKVDVKVEKREEQVTSTTKSKNYPTLNGLHVVSVNAQNNGQVFVRTESGLVNELDRAMTAGLIRSIQLGSVMPPADPRLGT